LIPRCTHQAMNQDRVLLKDTRNLEQQMNRMATKALRMIAIAIKRLQKDDILIENHLTKDLTFLGLFGLKDPPRREVASAIYQCKESVVRTVMITGDNRKTASAIPSKIGMLDEESKIIDGNELNDMTMDELTEVIEKVSLFARVTPEHKLKIVKAYQRIGHIVAMTGDGVNDAPAVKA